MTTPEAAARYLHQYLEDVKGREIAIHNPHDKPLDQLPTIYGFNNGGSYDMLQAIALSEDGHFLGSHCCSHEGYMMGDLGILKGTRDDRHKESYQKHYPDGYKMEFVGYSQVNVHEGLLAAIEKSKEVKAEQLDKTQFAGVAIETTSQ